MPRQPKNKLSPITPEQENIGKNLSALRKSKGLTQQELADKIGISRTSIADYERGKCRIYDLMIIRLANALNVTTDTILCAKNGKATELKPKLKFMKRLKEIEALPENKQKTILSSLDMMIDSAKRQK